MHLLVQAKTHKAIFIFCKVFLLISLILGALFLNFRIPLIAILTFKFCFWLFLYYLWTEERLQKQLVFYFNLGISKVQLFFIPMLYDSMVLLILYIFFL